MKASRKAAVWMFLLIMGGVGLLAANRDSMPKTVIVHPRLDLIVRSDSSGEPTWTISMPKGAQQIEAAGAGARGVVIGSFDAPSAEVFGLVQDALIYAPDRIAILDSQAAEVRIFDAEGRKLQVVGGHGSGPGEFRSPVALALGTDEELLVIDVLGRITVYQTGPDSLRLLTTISVRGDIFDACVLHDQLFLHGVLPGREELIHAVADDGAIQTSFGAVYRASSPIVRYQASKGRMACLQSANLLVLASNVLPDVRAYSPRGELLWTAGVEGFIPLEIQETATGGSRTMRPDNGHNLLTNVVATENNEFMLQVATRRKTGAEGYAVLHDVFVLNAVALKTRYVRKSPGRLLDWKDGAVAYSQDRPFPAVTFREEPGK